ncbi:MAG: hypothetical protein R2705_07205 [Ilumatobacteraceae bacterium]
MDVKAWIRAELELLDQRFAGQIAAHLPAEHWRRVRRGPEGHDEGASVAGMLWHVTYHHDLALSTAICDREPVFATWRDRLGVGHRPVELAISEAEPADAVAELDLDALLAYRAEVLAQTGAWLTRVTSHALDTIPASSRRLEQRAGIRRDEVGWFHGLWDGKDVGWLVRWELIGHGHTHLGEMVALRNALGHSPF